MILSIGCYVRIRVCDLLRPFGFSFSLGLFGFFFFKDTNTEKDIVTFFFDNTAFRKQGRQNGFQKVRLDRADVVAFNHVERKQFCVIILAIEPAGKMR